MDTEVHPLYFAHEESIMVHRFSRLATVAVVAAAAWFVLAADIRAQSYGAPGWPAPEPNYYAMPTGPDGLTAALYPSPRPTPPLVGQTYITYGALAPQEMLYDHFQFYRTCNDSGQVTRTSVIWGHHPRLWLLQPSLRNAAPGLHTPAGPACKF